MRTSTEHLQRTGCAIERFAHGIESYDDRSLVLEAAKHGLTVAHAAKATIADRNVVDL